MGIFKGGIFSPKFSKSWKISFMISSMKALLKCNFVTVPSQIQE